MKKLCICHETALVEGIEMILCINLESALDSWILPQSTLRFGSDEVVQSDHLRWWLLPIVHSPWWNQGLSVNTVWLLEQRSGLKFVSVYYILPMCSHVHLPLLHWHDVAWWIWVRWGNDWWIQDWSIAFLNSAAFRIWCAMYFPISLVVFAKASKPRLPGVMSYTWCLRASHFPMKAKVWEKGFFFFDLCLSAESPLGLESWLAWSCNMVWLQKLWQKEWSNNMTKRNDNKTPSVRNMLKQPHRWPPLLVNANEAIQYAAATTRSVGLDIESATLD